MVQRTTKVRLTKVKSVENLSLGCDPEFFFANKDGVIVGAEKILPKGGTTGGNKIIIDGVQGEMNPQPSTCRALLANSISSCFIELKRQIDKTGGMKVSFDSNIVMTQEELASLSEKSRQFGCAPSVNAYKKGETRFNIDGNKHLQRSAGGHIHLGSDKAQLREVLKDVKVTVPLLDIIVGNTCVMIDKDPDNAIRRKYYGKAGEFRLPIYGVEYRTLSNFWLRSYQLMSLVMGLSRLAVSIAWHDKANKPKNSIVEAIRKAVPITPVKTAINKNDVDLAKENYLKLRPILEQILPNSIRDEGYYDMVLSKNNLAAFDHFLSKDLDHWFNEDPIMHWTTLRDTHGKGFESFLENHVKPELAAEKDKTKKNIEDIQWKWNGIASQG